MGKLALNFQSRTVHAMRLFSFRGPAIHTYRSLYLCGSARNLFARCLCTARIGYPSFTPSQPGPAHERLDCAGLLSRKLPVLAQRTARPPPCG